MPELNFQDIQRAGDIAAPVVSGKGSARFTLSASLSGSPIPVGTSNTLVHTFPINIITPVSAQTGMTLCYPGIPHKSTSSKNPLKVYVKTKDSATALGVLGYVIRYYPIDNEGNQAAETYGYSTE